MRHDETPSFPAYYLSAAEYTRYFGKKGVRQIRVRYRTQLEI